jgi:hypothetical protein
MSELIDVCKKLDAAGYIPIGEGDADQWRPTPIFSDSECSVCPG